MRPIDLGTPDSWRFLMLSRCLIALVIAAMAAALGCSSGSGPLTPDPGIKGMKAGPAGFQANHLVPWGVWEVTLNPASGTADILSLRGLEFTADVTQFMQPPISPKHLMEIAIDPATDWIAGHVIVDVSFSHPFPGLDTYTGFDVRGACIGDGTIAGITDPNVMYAGPEDLRVLNADGLTRWFNPAEFTTYGTIFGFTLGKLGTPVYDFTSTLNGYKYFCDGLEKDTDVAEFFSDPGCANPRGYFSAGNKLTRTYDLQFPTPGGTPQYKFQYAVIAGWESPVVSPPVNIPGDFTLSANCQESYVIKTSDESDLYFVSESEKGGGLALDVTVYDHQGATNSAGVSDEIFAVQLESHAGLIKTDLAVFDSAALASALLESNEKFARYLLTVPEAGCDPTSGGDMPILVAVLSTDPVSYDSGFPGFDFPAGALAAYSMATVHVSDMITNQPPVAVAEIVGGDNIIFEDQSLGFDGSSSYDPDGTIVSYEWDADDDGAYDDATGPNPSIQFNTTGIFHVDLKVTDNKGATDTLDTKLEVDVRDKIIHVDDDNVSGPWNGFEEHPYKFIQDGIDAVPDATGWMVRVHPGTYVTPLEDSGNPYGGGMVKIENKFNMTLYGDEGAIIDPPYWCLVNGMSAIRVRYGSSDIVIDNFIIRPRYAYQAAIWCESVDGITVQNCSLEPPNESYGFLEFFRSQDCSDLVIKDNMMDTFNSASTFMYVFVVNYGSNVTITGNVVTNLNYWTGGNSGQMGEGYVYFYSVSDGEISKNKFGEHARSYGCSNYADAPVIDLWGGSDITVRNNLIYDTHFSNPSGPEHNYAVHVTSGCSDVKIYNNTIDRLGPTDPPGGTGYSYGVWVENGSVSEFYSNIITNTQAPSAATCYGAWSASSLSLDYTDIYGVVGGITGLYGGSASPGTDFITADPMYVDPAGYDYHLAAGSPCIGTGKDGEDMGCYGGADPLE